VIDRPLRDEGTSYHYAPQSEYSEADRELITTAARALKAKGLNAVTGSSWTTDAPFRETEEAITVARSKGIGSECARRLQAVARASGPRIALDIDPASTVGRTAQSLGGRRAAARLRRNVQSASSCGTARSGRTSPREPDGLAGISFEGERAGHRKKYPMPKLATSSATPNAATRLTLGRRRIPA
jgi:phosphorylase superfamily protein